MDLRLGSLPQSLKRQASLLTNEEWQQITAALVRVTWKEIFPTVNAMLHQAGRQPYKTLKGMQRGYYHFLHRRK